MSSLKHCNKCDQDKPLEEFYPEKRNADGVMGCCKKCHVTYQMAWRRGRQAPRVVPVIMAKICNICGTTTPVEKLLQYVKRDGSVGYRSICEDCRAKDRKISYLKNIVRVRQYQHKYNTSEAKSEINKRYRIENPLTESQKVAKKHGDYIRNAIKAFLKNPENNPDLSYVGCNVETFVRHLSRRAPEGFSWDQYEYDKYHIDHILPLSLYDLTKEESKLKIFHFTNTQILSRWSNQSKGNREEPGPNLLK